MSRFWHQRFALATRQDLATLDEDRAAVNEFLAITRIIGYCARQRISINRKADRASS